MLLLAVVCFHPAATSNEAGVRSAGVGKWRREQPSAGEDESTGAGVPLPVGRGGCCQPPGLLHFPFAEDGCSLPHSCRPGPWPRLLGAHCGKFCAVNIGENVMCSVTWWAQVLAVGSMVKMCGRL